MPDQRLPDALLSRAYGIAVIPDVIKVAFIFGGRHGNGVLVVRDKLNTPWSNPVFISLTGGSWGFQAGAQSSDIILVFTTKSGIEGDRRRKVHAGSGRLRRGGPLRTARIRGHGCWLLAEIYSYARTRGLFGGIALDGSVLSIDRSANGSYYHKRGVTASEIFSGQAPAPPETAQRFLERLAQATRTTVRNSPAPQADVPAASSAPATAGGARGGAAAYVSAG